MNAGIWLHSERQSVRRAKDHVSCRVTPCRERSLLRAWELPLNGSNGSLTHVRPGKPSRPKAVAAEYRQAYLHPESEILLERLSSIWRLDHRFDVTLVSAAIRDTTGIRRHALRRSRSRLSPRLRTGVPRGHWKTTTFVAGLRRTGMVAPWVLDGPMNGDAFTTYVTRVMAPELSRGDVVIMDNLSSHKAPAVCAAIQAAGARLLFLPPYSPDFNPIEQAFSKLESPPAQSRRANHPRPLERHRAHPRPLLTTGVRQLLCQRRLRCRLIRKRSKDTIFVYIERGQPFAAPARKLGSRRRLAPNSSLSGMDAALQIMSVHDEPASGSELSPRRSLVKGSDRRTGARTETR